MSPGTPAPPTGRREATGHSRQPASRQPASREAAGRRADPDAEVRTLAPGRPRTHGPRPANRPPGRAPGTAHRRPAARRRPARRVPGPASRGILGRRIRAFRVLLVLLFVVIAARLVDLQVLSSGRYQAQASEEQTQLVTIPALRGSIYARNGSVLAMSEQTKTVIADDFQIQHPLAEARRLAPLLGLQAVPLASQLHQHSGYVPLARQVPVGRAARVAAGNFAGITMVASSQRVTPDGNLAAPLIGAVHASGGGASGVEYQENRLLSGSPGSETLLESPSGVVLPGTPVAEHRAAHPGTGVELTLDPSLQYTTEQDLAAEIQSSHAVSGTAEVMDVKTGEILSMANLVNNTPNAGNGSGSATTAPGTKGPVVIGSKGPVSEAPDALALTQVYEPGSVFKLVTFSAALQDGVINPTTTFTVPDQLVYDGSVFHDAETHPTQPMTATQILAQSSNIGTSEIAQALGESRLLAQVDKLGFGKVTTLGFPGEEAGIIAGAQQWEPTNYVSLPIGQVDAVTPQQVLDAYDAEANGGVLVQPRLVLATVHGNRVRPTAPSATRRVYPASVAGQLVPMLEQVVRAGTGTAAFIPGYSVAGKTGTSQIPATGKVGYATGAFDATFVGFAPASHPVLAAIVVLNRPNPIYGGSVSAPVFSQVMRYALHRYDIPTTPSGTTTPPPSLPAA